MNETYAHADMLEATRLTRAGQLTEATALLQRAASRRTPDSIRSTGDTARRLPAAVRASST